MRVFLTLCSLAAVALAKPQYNYGNGVSGTFGINQGGSSGGLGPFAGGSSFASGGSFGSGSNGGGSLGSGSLGGGSLGGGSLGGGALGGGSLGGNSLGGGSLGGGALGGGSLGGGSLGGGSLGGGSTFGGGNSYQSPSANYNQHSHQSFEAPLVHKQFITVAAPEDHDSLERTKHLVLGRAQKNYRVVFIKAPSSSNSNVRLSAEYAPKEDKTVIYVLSKKDSSLDINDIATPAPTVPAKPEVFFIKYKTEAEAQHAQRQIQAEYDKIEGSSEHTDAGVAPQQSVVGILGNGNNAGVGSSGSFASGGSSSSLGGGGSSSGFIGGSGSIGGGHNAVKSSAYLPPATV